MSYTGYKKDNNKVRAQLSFFKTSKSQHSFTVRSTKQSKVSQENAPMAKQLKEVVFFFGKSVQRIKSQTEMHNFSAHILATFLCKLKLSSLNV